MTTSLLSNEGHPRNIKKVIMKIFENASFREQQALKIYAILKDHFGQSDFSDFVCLEVGCGSGEISSYFAGKMKAIWGIDISPNLFKKNLLIDNSTFGLSVSNGANLPFPNSHFNIILLPQVYEHTKKQQEIFNEIYRVLQPGGVCFFSGPNKFQLIERHYYLPFLSWLPNKLSSIYLKITQKADYYDIYPRSYWRIKKLVKEFSRIDYTSQIIRDPKKFNMQERFGKIKLSILPSWFIQLFEPLFPNYNWILVKEK